MSTVIVMSGTIKKYINRFLEANITTPENAINPLELGCKKTVIISQLVSNGILIQVGEGKYYLNEDGLEGLVSPKRKVSFVILSVMLVLALVVLAYYY